MYCGESKAGNGQEQEHSQVFEETGEEEIEQLETGKRDESTNLFHWLILQEKRL